MDPFYEERWYDVWPERIAWHVFTAGVLGLLLLILLVSVDSLGESQPAVDAGPPARIAVPVEIEPVEARTRRSSVQLPAVVEPAARVELGFRVDGHVARIRVDEGEAVEVGEVIADLDRDDLERDVRLATATLASARARAQDAEARFGRRSVLLARGTTSREQHTDAELALALARAGATEAELRLAAASSRLAHASLRAPFSGVIEHVLIDEHERASAHQPVVVLTDLARVKIRASAPDALIARLLPGARATVHAPAWPGVEFRGVVSRIDVAVDPVTRTIPFEIVLENPERRLRPELAVELDVELVSVAGAISLPLAAVLRDDGPAPFCFVVEAEADGALQARRRGLVLGEVLRDRVAILEGLEPGENVVVHGQHFVHAGDVLDVTETLEH